MVGDPSSTPKVDAQRWFSRRILEDFGDVKIILAELIIGGGNMLSTKLDTCKCIQAIEQQPSLGTPCGISFY